MKNKNIITLDCTLRDGGYYNNWDFSKDLVNKYLRVMSDIEVDYVEIGFRSLKVKGFAGPYAFSTDEYIKSLDLPSNIKIGVMINASDFLINGKFSIKHLNELVKLHSDKTPVKLVRIAAHIFEITESVHAINYLKSLGYIVGFNVMQISQANDIEITDFLEVLSSLPIDVLYFADSLGSLLPHQIARILDLFKSNWYGDMGIHAHDNLGFALQNTLVAHENGAKWLDSTVLGMGRGPGNAKTEELFSYFFSNEEIINLQSLSEIVTNDFSRLKEEYKWGTNIFYFLSGRYEIHPTYIQNMLKDQRFSSRDVLSVIDQLKLKNSSKYDVSILSGATNFYSSKSKGKWKPNFNTSEALIIGTGPSSSIYKDDIINFIKDKDLLILALNYDQNMNYDFIHYHVACNPSRLLADISYYNMSNKPLIAPMSDLPGHISNSFIKSNIYDFGIQVSDDEFSVGETACVLSNSMVLSYSLAILISANIYKIYMVGFDGYPQGDSRNSETNKILKDFTTRFTELQLISLHPTNYSIDTVSIYNPKYS